MRDPGYGIRDTRCGIRDAGCHPEAGWARACPERKPKGGNSQGSGETALSRPENNGDDTAVVPPRIVGRLCQTRPSGWRFTETPYKCDRDRGDSYAATRRFCLTRVDVERLPALLAPFRFGL